MTKYPPGTTWRVRLYYPTFSDWVYSAVLPGVRSGAMPYETTVRAEAINTLRQLRKQHPDETYRLVVLRPKGPKAPQTGTDWHLSRTLKSGQEGKRRDMSTIETDAAQLHWHAEWLKRCESLSSLEGRLARTEKELETLRATHVADIEQMMLLKKERDELKAEVEWMTKERDELKVTLVAVRTEREDQYASRSRLIKERDELIRQRDALEEFEQAARYGAVAARTKAIRDVVLRHVTGQHALTAELILKAIDALDEKPEAQ